MKFTWKVFLSAMLVMAVSFSTGGYFMVTSVFQSALEREIASAQEQNHMLRFSFETAAASIYSGTQELDDSTLREIARSIDAGGYARSNLLRISDGTTEGIIYTGNSLPSDLSLLTSISEGTRGYRMLTDKGRYYIQSACYPYAGGRTIYLESFRDVTSLFNERAQHFTLYSIIELIVLAAGGLLMLLLSHWLTRPLRMLSRTAREIAGGAYDKRAQIHSHDEAGDLAQNFNSMTDALETKIHELEDAARRQEDFVASFAHELKTPLTSIIGYADLLRSRELAANRRFDAATYIYTEGRRLESLSLKMMDMIVLHRQDFPLRQVNAQTICQSVYETIYPVAAQNGISLRLTRADDTKLLAEPDLLKTLLLNLLDNARKASAPNTIIELSGEQIGSCYRFTVRDYGSGIPAAELTRITEPFYMVDKSRARAKGGAGLGLAICANIAAIHGSKLQFESAPGHGTTVTFTLSCE